MRQLQTPNVPFTFHTTSLFSNLVEATTEFDMVSTFFHNYPELYPIYNDTKNDVQILFKDSTDGKSAGHAICVFYNAANKTIFIYDSQYHQSRGHYKLSDKMVIILNRRYPNHQNIVCVEAKTIQIDETSCGPFSIAYATSLINGHDPKTHKLKTIPVFSGTFHTKKFDYAGVFRAHILKMFRSKKLLKFAFA